jgi:aminoglycoside phosphotransferase (APT) family kinase protein
MGMSLIAEGAVEPKKLNTYSYRAFVQTARLLVPLVVVAVLGAPIILQLFGSKYAEQAPDLLRLLCLSALPNMVVSMFLSIARVRRQVRAIVLVQAGICILVLGQTFLLLEPYGVTGVGIAWLSSQTIMAIILGVTQLGSVWLHDAKLPGIARLLAIPRRVWRAWTRRNDLPQARRILPAILHKMQSAAGHDGAPEWQAQRLLPTLNDITVITLGAAGQAPVAVLKLPRSEVAVASLKRQIGALQDLHRDDRLGEWRSSLPKPLVAGNVGRQFFAVEELVNGERAESLLESSETRITAQITALAWLETFHRRTSGQQKVDAEMLQRLIGEPLRTVRDWNAHRRNGQKHAPAIDRLETELHKALSGRTVTVSRTHGDFTPGNILMEEGGRRITGVLDWELSRQADLPLVDVIQFLLAGRMLTHKRELGDIMRDLLGTTSWTDEERQILAHAQAALPGDTLDSRAMLLLAWLRHVSDNLNKSAHYATHWLWTAKNVDGVLSCV